MAVTSPPSELFRFTLAALHSFSGGGSATFVDSLPSAHHPIIPFPKNVTDVTLVTLGCDASERKKAQCSCGL